MQILEEILNEMLLTESVSIEDVNSAIDNHERIIINYHTKGEDANTGARVIEVYAYGLTKASNHVIRAYQPYGDTTSKVPSWKFFRLDRISSWKPTGQIFSHPIDFYDKSAPPFNPNGDDTMSVVYKIADFSGNNKDNINMGNVDNGPKLQQNEPYKTDTERNMERLRNQLNNPIKLTDIKTDRGFKGVEMVKTQETGPKVKSDEPYKTDTERNMERLRKQLDNPTKIDLSTVGKKSKNDNNDIKDLRQKLGDTSKPISFSDLQQRLGNNKSELEDTTYKTDTERNMERLRKQLDNPTKIDLSRIPKR